MAGWEEKSKQAKTAMLELAAEHEWIETEKRFFGQRGHKYEFSNF